MRVASVLLLSLGLLAACGREPEPPAASSAPPARVEPLPAVAAAPAIKAPAADIAPAAPAPEAASARVTTSAKSSPGPAVAAPEPEIHAALDLSVPRELLESLPATSGSELSPLLPPLFVDKGEAISPFQLSGRLISNEREDDYWSSIEGAELQFEFRQ